jgi:hypothetical protein
MIIKLDENIELRSLSIDLNIEEYFEFLNFIDKKILDNKSEEPRYRLKDIWEIYKLALAKRIPKIWSDYLEEFKKIKDPEYDLYLKLKNKFEGKGM